jgi:hypothetical protein
MEKLHLVWTEFQRRPPPLQRMKLALVVQLVQERELEATWRLVEDVAEIHEDEPHHRHMLDGQPSLAVVVMETQGEYIVVLAPGHLSVHLCLGRLCLEGRIANHETVEVRLRWT